MIVAEFTLTYPILEAALERTPSVSLEWERSDMAGEDVTVLTWALGSDTDLDGFERALADDASVRNTERIAAVDGRRLYHITLDRIGQEVSVYPVIVDAGGIIRQATADDDGWHFRVAFPDQQTFTRFRTVCDNQGIDLTLHTLLVEEASSDHDRYGLTDRQRELLDVALDAGYFDIPRSASLEDVADELEISQNAASERLRRGLRGLLAETVGSEPTTAQPAETD